MVLAQRVGGLFGNGTQFVAVRLVTQLGINIFHFQKFMIACMRGVLPGKQRGAEQQPA